VHRPLVLIALDESDGVAALPAQTRVRGARRVTPVAVDPLTFPALFRDTYASLNLLQRQFNLAGAREVPVIGQKMRCNRSLAMVSSTTEAEVEVKSAFN
jgi:hypothetical protein